MKIPLQQLILFGTVAMMALVVPTIDGDQLTLPCVRQIPSDATPGEIFSDIHSQNIATKRRAKKNKRKSNGKKSATENNTEKTEEVNNGDEDNEIPMNPSDLDALTRAPSAGTPGATPSRSPASSDASPQPTCLECDDAPFVRSSSAFNNNRGGGSQHDNSAPAAGSSTVSKEVAAYLCYSLLSLIF